MGDSECPYPMSSQIATTVFVTIPSRPSLPPELIHHILRFANRSTLLTCLTVSQILFDVAGSLLYKCITLKTPSKKCPLHLIPDQIPANTHTKSHLMKKVQHIVANNHPDQTGASSYELPNLKTIRLTGPEIVHWRSTYTLFSLLSCPVIKNSKPTTVILDGMAGLFPGGAYHHTSLQLNFDSFQNVLQSANTLVIVTQARSHLYPHALNTPYTSSYMQAFPKSLEKVVVVHYPQPTLHSQLDEKRFKEMEESVVNDFVEFVLQYQGRVTFAHVLLEDVRRIGEEKMQRVDLQVRGALQAMGGGKDMVEKLEELQFCRLEELIGNDWMGAYEEGDGLFERE